MTVATDIAALKARCAAIEKRLTAVEAKNATQTTSILDLRARCDALGAKPPFNPAPILLRLSEIETQVTKLTNSLPGLPT